MLAPEHDKLSMVLPCSRLYKLHLEQSGERRRRVAQVRVKWLEAIAQS